MSNLPLALGQPLETVANTGYDLPPHGVWVESFSAGDGLAAYQLVGGVMAHQGDDG